MRMYVLIGVVSLTAGLLIGIFGSRLSRGSSPSATRVVVPDVTRITATNAARLLNARGFHTTLVLRTAGSAQAGRVFRQHPTGGTELAPGSEIELIVARQH